jgi:hypothetical protein
MIRTFEPCTPYEFWSRSFATPLITTIAVQSSNSFRTVAA